MQLLLALYFLRSRAFFLRSLTCDIDTVICDLLLGRYKLKQIIYIHQININYETQNAAGRR